MTNSLSSTEQKMIELLAESNILTDQLYHLQNSDSITNYDPDASRIILDKDSSHIQSFKTSNTIDLWPSKNARTTRKVATDTSNKIANLKKKFDPLINERISQKLDSSIRSKRKLRNDNVASLNTPAKKRKSSKFKLIFNKNVPPPVITHPDHKPVHKFNSIDELFESYRNIIEDPAPEIDASEFENYLKDQNDLINNIKYAINDKKLLYIDYKENVFRQVPTGVKEPTMIKRNPHYNINNYKPDEDPFRMKNDLTHFDHLIAQGVKSSKLVHDLRVNKIQKCRKIAQMIELHFKRLSQENDKKEKEYKKKIQRLAKDTAREVKKKWLIAVKAYRILEERDKEKMRAQKSKEQLSKILDHSTKVLGAQLAGKSQSVIINEENVKPIGDDDDDGNDVSDVSDDDDENMSSSSDEEEASDGKSDNEDDSKLTPEQLKKKYTGLNNVTSEISSKSKSLTSLYDDNVADDSNSILSESLSGSDSTSDSEFSSEYSDNDVDDEIEKSNDSQPQIGLQALFGNVDESNNEDNDSVYSEAEETNTPSSSPGNAIPEPLEDINGIPNVPIPSLLKGTLRPYQKQGLNWLASLYNNGTNGILADEMGLGKTIQTISLLAYLACEKNEWGPHLIVVPTSVMLNWEMEFKRFAPGFKVLTYYGSPQQRKEKRKGWNTPDSFHVCITSYQLVVHDQPIFRRKKWKYMILDEAHNIKNFRSQRWKALLNFNTEHRLLLTGTPLQNNIIELWSLLYFLMPSSADGDFSMPEGFADLMDFQQWFGKPVDKIIQQGANDIEAKETVNKLHQVLRPYLLRRLKQDVEKQMPLKYEHIVYCRLSKRQRLLYDDFMSRAQTKETLASGNFLSIINCLMQLRKVCNHPDLFEVRPIVTSFAQTRSVISEFEIENILVENLCKSSEAPDLKFLNLIHSLKYFDDSNIHHSRTISKISASSEFQNTIEKLEQKLEGKSLNPNFDDLESYYEYILNREDRDLLEFMKQRKYVNDFNCDKPLFFSSTLIDIFSLKKSKSHMTQLRNLHLIPTLEDRSIKMKDIIEKYTFVTPKAVCNNMNQYIFPQDLQNELLADSQSGLIQNPFHQVQVKSSIAFPDKSLLQYDCGKLQKLAALLHDIIPKGHRVLIFTQMSKVLDILEQFLNFNGYTYMRLDGATKIEDRQLMTERFNNDTRIKCFVLSTRAGGLGINLTGADTVVFYDSDWNPAIDKQCQDRCHRIGQTRDVHIYRFVSEFTIEANILKKAEQKKHLDNVVIQDGDFTTDYFNKVSVQELLGDSSVDVTKGVPSNSRDFTKALEMAEDEDDAKAAEIAMRETNVDVEDFSDTEKDNGSAAPPTDLSEAATPAPTSTGDGLEADEVVKRVEKLQESKIDVDDDIDSDDDFENDDGIGHIDEYMIRFIAGGFYFD
ncbi:hypothetical protein CANINC_002609 [Pichia inconspicua]|uniref:Helicase SWR1 n=1 Tax=Pichia inconspicua TaxID=52247 RepID=A0A4V4NFN4_9ASCO|nr:hypothetical protein CANINC_002609 [[Candida] inconspicua]